MTQAWYRAETSGTFPRTYVNYEPLLIRIDIPQKGLIFDTIDVEIETMVHEEGLCGIVFTSNSSMESPKELPRTVKSYTSEITISRVEIPFHLLAKFVEVELKVFIKHKGRLLCDGMLLYTRMFTGYKSYYDQDCDTLYSDLPVMMHEPDEDLKNLKESALGDYNITDFGFDVSSDDELGLLYNGLTLSRDDLLLSNGDLILNNDDSNIEMSMEQSPPTVPDIVTTEIDQKWTQKPEEPIHNHILIHIRLTYSHNTTAYMFDDFDRTEFYNDFIGQAHFHTFPYLSTHEKSYVALRLRYMELNFRYCLGKLINGQQRDMDEIHLYTLLYALGRANVLNARVKETRKGGCKFIFINPYVGKMSSAVDRIGRLRCYPIEQDNGEPQRSDYLKLFKFWILFDLILRNITEPIPEGIFIIGFESKHTLTEKNCIFFLPWHVFDTVFWIR